ncbi:spore coat protein S [Paenibacillus sp. 32O-W]|uniref:CotS family spore coat protein n=1 Tax=Paenibacillus sp. 32O-W TaxID=1695218 RepID=UPI00071FDC9B|nr:CotS family spore coat protein [Paenibacillus sp. 32O-W]ALS28096.1 spore coat protein S [Paenibacillus sp. 32O-W]
MVTQTNINTVLSQYPLRVKSVKLINDKGKKAAWTVETASGTKIMKKSPSAKERLLFLIQATKHLQQHGARIPRIVPTKTGQDFAEDANGDLYVLSDAIQGKTPSYTAEEVGQIMSELAKFHLASRGFYSRFETKEREHLGRWEKGYQSHLDRLEAFKNLANKSDSPFAKLYIQHADAFISQGKKAINLIQGDAYKRWVSKVEVQRNLCHQDFAAANLIKTQQGYFIIDMDSLTLDLPARDIRKIFNKVMKKTGWSATKATSMLRAYHALHPLTAEECQVIYADLLFPHLFYGLASKYFNQRAEWNLPRTYKKLEALIGNEKSRLQMLASWDSIVRNALK